MKIPSVLLVFILPAGFHRNVAKVKHPWDPPMSPSELMSEFHTSHRAGSSRERQVGSQTGREN